MHVEVRSSGDLTFRQMAPLCADTLMRLPALLESEDPAVRERLLPRTYDDPEEEKAWRTLGATELEHLILSRAELLRRDLATMRPDGPMTFRLDVQRPHVAAWLASLNAGRQALFLLHDLSPEDMEREPGEVGDPDKELALVRMFLMALMQELLLEAKR